MGNRYFLFAKGGSFLIFPILSISLPAFSAHFIHPSMATVFSWLFHVSNFSLLTPVCFYQLSRCTFLSPFRETNILQLHETVFYGAIFLVLEFLNFWSPLKQYVAALITRRIESLRLSSCPSGSVC